MKKIIIATSVLLVSALQVYAIGDTPDYTPITQAPPPSYQRPLAPSYPQRVQTGGMFQAQASTQTSYIPSYRPPTTIGESVAYDPCPAGRFDSTALQIQNGVPVQFSPAGH